MKQQERLLDDISRGAHPLLAPKALAHSQELADTLPLVRRFVGPRIWYQCLEASNTPARPPQGRSQ